MNWLLITDRPPRDEADPDRRVLHLGGSQGLDVAPWAEDAQRAVADGSRRLLDETRSGGGLGELLGPRWWYLQTVERNAARDPLVELLYRLALTVRACAEGPWARVEIDVAEPRLARVLWLNRDRLRAVWRGSQPGPPAAFWPRFLLGWLKSALSLTFTCLALRFLSSHPRPLAPGAHAFTVFPFFWRQGEERYFPAWRGPWLGWVARPWRHIRTVRRHGIQPLQAFLRPGDAWALLEASHLRTVLERLARLRLTFEGLELGPLVAELLASSFTRPDYFFCRLVETAMRRVAHVARPGAEIIYRVEHHPFESALLHGLNGSLPTYGYRHCVFSPYYLTLRLDPAEPRLHPTRYWVNSCQGRELLLRDGVPRERVLPCGPQRHAALARYLSSRPPPEKARAALEARFGTGAGSRFILFAMCVRPEENRTALEALRAALRTHPELHLLVRPHPAHPQPPAPEPRLLCQAADEPCFEWLDGCEALITPGSTLAFEALALGVVPIIHEDPASYAFYSLADYGHWVFLTRSQAELLVALEEVAAGGPGARLRRERAAAAVQAVFGDLARPLAAQLSEALSLSRSRAQA